MGQEQEVGAGGKLKGSNSASDGRCEEKIWLAAFTRQPQGV